MFEVTLFRSYFITAFVVVLLFLFGRSMLMRPTFKESHHETEAEKASRILQKAKRMCPTDTSIDDLLTKAKGIDGPAFCKKGPKPTELCRCFSVCLGWYDDTPCKMKHVQKMLGGTFNLKTSQVNVACEKRGRDDESNEKYSSENGWWLLLYYYYYIILLWLLIIVMMATPFADRHLPH